LAFGLLLQFYSSSYSLRNSLLNAYHFVVLQFLDGWVIFAEYARPRTPPGQSAYPETIKHIG